MSDGGDAVVGVGSPASGPGASSGLLVASARPDRSRSRRSGCALAVGVGIAKGDGVDAVSIGIVVELDRSVEMAGAGLMTWLSTMLTPCHAIVVAATAAPTQRMTKARARIIR